MHWFHIAEAGGNNNHRPVSGTQYQFIAADTAVAELHIKLINLILQDIPNAASPLDCYPCALANQNNIISLRQSCYM